MIVETLQLVGHCTLLDACFRGVMPCALMRRASTSRHPTGCRRCCDEPRMHAPCDCCPDRPEFLNWYSACFNMCESTPSTSSETLGDQGSNHTVQPSAHPGAYQRGSVCSRNSMPSDHRPGCGSNALIHSSWQQLLLVQAPLGQSAAAAEGTSAAQPAAAEAHSKPGRVNRGAAARAAGASAFAYSQACLTP